MCVYCAGNTDKSYEVVIGANEDKESYIRESIGGENLVTVSTPNILLCNSQSYFWVSVCVYMVAQAMH